MRGNSSVDEQTAEERLTFEKEGFQLRSEDVFKEPYMRVKAGTSRDGHIHLNLLALVGV